MAPKTKTEQKITEIPNEVIPEGGRVIHLVSPDKTPRQKLRERTLANYMYSIVSARSQPDVTSACVKLAAEYDDEMGEFLFSIEEIEKIIQEARRDGLACIGDLRLARELTIDLAANL